MSKNRRGERFFSMPLNRSICRAVCLSYVDNKSWGHTCKVAFRLNVGQVTGITEDALRSKSRDRATVSARVLIAGAWKETWGKLAEGSFRAELIPLFQRDLSVISKPAKTAARDKGKEIRKVLQTINASLQA